MSDTWDQARVAEIRKLLGEVEGLSEELAVARELLRKTWWLPVEGTSMPIYRAYLTLADREAIVQYLTLIGAERYVPKEKK